LSKHFFPPGGYLTRHRFISATKSESFHPGRQAI
jgi:hypothetical protein